MQIHIRDTLQISQDAQKFAEASYDEGHLKAFHRCCRWVALSLASSLEAIHASKKSCE